MPRDYREVIAALRRKAADPSVTKPEREALTAKADELAEKYGIRENIRPFVSDVRPFVSDVRYYSPVEREEFIRTFFGDPRPNHTVVFPSRGGKTTFNIWLSDLDEDPQQNGWWDHDWLDTED